MIDPGMTDRIRHLAKMLADQLDVHSSQFVNEAKTQGDVVERIRAVWAATHLVQQRFGMALIKVGMSSADICFEKSAALAMCGQEMHLEEQLQNGTPEPTEGDA